MPCIPQKRRAATAAGLFGDNLAVGPVLESAAEEYFFLDKIRFLFYCKYTCTYSYILIIIIVHVEVLWNTAFFH